MSNKIRNTALDSLKQASNTAGLFSIKSAAKYSSGARTVLKMNGAIVGFAFNISWRVSTDWVEINTIDDYMAAELAPRRVTVDGSLGMLHIPGQSATSNLWQADQLSFLFQKYVSIEVRDSATDQLLFYAPQAAIVTRSEDISVDALSKVTLSFKAIGWKDEQTPKIPE